MKSSTNLKKGSRLIWTPFNRAIKGLIGGALVLTGMQASLQAQEIRYTVPSWYFGVAGGANINFYRGTTQVLNSAFSVPAAFYDGNGIGLYVAPLIEFHRPDTRLGFMFQAGYDSRKGAFKKVTSPCNCPEDLKTDLNYLTVEPSLRFAPFKSNFYLYGGPRFAFNMTKSFIYRQGINPAYPGQIANPDVKGDFSSVNDNLISMQIGAGYDIPLTRQYKRTQFVLSPFVSFQPYYGQDPRTVESWNITTIRAGLALKLGGGRKIVPAEVFVPVAIVVPEPIVLFSVNAPINLPVERRVSEIFPLRNYIFFDIGSNEIPNRYVLISKEEVNGFKKSQMEVREPKKLSGRSRRQMSVYYNVINILGDRMQENSATTILLVGSSEKGPKDGQAMAESVKHYLVGTFGIGGSRIKIEGRRKPKLPSEQPGGKLELVLLREGDRRVSIESNSPALLMEFQSGPVVTMKPVEIISVQEAPAESYVSVKVVGGNDAFSSWSLEFADETGKIQNFGPYTKEEVNIPGKTILGSRPEGNYKVTMIGQAKSGKVVRKETSAHMVMWTPPADEEMMRFSILYEFNKSKAISIYQSYLTDMVIPLIPNGGTVMIQGYTDIIGGEDSNLKLSVTRAKDAQTILESGLAKAGRSDVIFEVRGLGEDQSSAPFENKYPEERFYNRTVIIDIIPAR
jgi:outer membrane protein OmpA-like peptidoglycan-associated protein